MSILIVEDSPHIHTQLKLFLKSSGYHELVCVDSAREAFNYLNLEGSEETSRVVDLILMDINMPEINGIEACRRIKANRRFQYVPILMVTAEDAGEGLQMAFDAGAVDYIRKPLNKVELIARVNSALRLKQEIDNRIKREEELLKLTGLLEETNQKLYQANEMLYQISRTDGLTGIANRRHFDVLFEAEWHRAARLSKPISLMLIDIDFFKNYNDTYGHQRGDECLKRVANALNMTLKRPCDVFARYGGEEFVAVLPDTNRNGAIKVAESMQSNVAALDITHKDSQAGNTVTISIGISSIVPEMNGSPELLITGADSALYKAKQEGRNRIKVQ